MTIHDIIVEGKRNPASRKQASPFLVHQMSSHGAKCTERHWPQSEADTYSFISIRCVGIVMFSTHASGDSENESCLRLTTNKQTAAVSLN